MPRISAANLAEHRDRTTTRLLDAFEATLAEEGFAELTLASVAERAGIARNTVYNYAKDKQALLVAAVERALGAVLADVDAHADPDLGAEEQLCAVIDRLMADFAGGPPRLLVLQSIQGMPLPHADADLPSARLLATRIEDVIRRGIDSGEFRPVGDVALTVALLAGAMTSAVHALGRGDREPEHVSSETKALILHAIRA